LRCSLRQAPFPDRGGAFVLLAAFRAAQDMLPNGLLFLKEQLSTAFSQVFPVESGEKRLYGPVFQKKYFD
jgi:hypothetical protein